MKTQLIHFTFKPSGYGHYEVTYTSPITSKKWTVKTSNIPLIDVTKNCEYPRQEDLNELKRVCKYKPNN